MRKILNFITIQYHLFESWLIYYLSKLISCNSGIIEYDIQSLHNKKNIVFIMGSGYSINDISAEEWNILRNKGDIIAFNYFHKGEFIPIDYHIVREMGHFHTVLCGRNILESYTNCMFNNPCYKNTRYFVLYDKKSRAAMWAVFFLKLFRKKKVCFYKNIDDRTLILSPSEDINAIPHCRATIFDAVNIGYLLGYKKIVLIGVDLYDRRYFWLKRNETRIGDLKRGTTYADIHNTANTTIKAMLVWKKYLRPKKIEIYVYNPRSLLSSILPIYKLCK